MALAHKREVSSVEIFKENGATFIGVRRKVGVWDDEKGDWVSPPTYQGEVLNGNDAAEAKAIATILGEEFAEVAAHCSRVNAANEKLHADLSAVAVAISEGGEIEPDTPAAEVRKAMDAERATVRMLARQMEGATVKVIKPGDIGYAGDGKSLGFQVQFPDPAALAAEDAKARG